MGEIGPGVEVQSTRLRRRGLFLCRRNLLPDKFWELLARQAEILFRRDGGAEVDFHFTTAREGMELAGLGGDQLHVRDEHRHDRDARLLGDVINSRLTGGDVHAVAARAFRVRVDPAVVIPGAVNVRLTVEAGAAAPFATLKVEFTLQP